MKMRKLMGLKPFHILNQMLIAEKKRHLLKRQANQPKEVVTQQLDYQNAQMLRMMITLSKEQSQYHIQNQQLIVSELIHLLKRQANQPKEVVTQQLDYQHALIQKMMTRQSRELLQ